MLPGGHSERFLEEANCLGRHKSSGTDNFSRCCSVPEEPFFLEEPGCHNTLETSELSFKPCTLLLGRGGDPSKLGEDFNNLSWGGI